MEKDLGRIKKKEDTDIVIRLDDFGGRLGLTVREFVDNDQYTGFTKSGTRIPADKIARFKDILDTVSEEEIKQIQEEVAEKAEEEDKKPGEKSQPKDQETL